MPSMRAVQVLKPDGPFQVVECPVPPPGEGQVLVTA